MSENRKIFNYKSFLLTIFLLVPFLGNCKKQEQEINNGKISFVRGDVTLIRGGISNKLNRGDIITKLDKIQTGEKSSVIVVFNLGESQVEIQSNSLFSFDEYSEKSASLTLEKGNIWFEVNKKDQKDFRVANPAAVAGVRGTKFYTFQIDADTFGTCHCEGQVEYSIQNSSEKFVNEMDYMIISRKGKSVKILPEEIMSIMGPMDGHQHSELDDSQLGKKANHSPEKIEKLMALIEKKFQEK